MSKTYFLFPLVIFSILNIFIVMCAIDNQRLWLALRIFRIERGHGQNCYCSLAVSNAVWITDTDILESFFL